MIQRFANCEPRRSDLQGRRPKVVICQYRLLHYRVDLFELLRDQCEQEGIQLEIIYGQPSKQEKTRHDTADLNWATPVHNSFVTIGGVDILWQPFPRAHRDADLVIVMQENRIVSNYLHIMKSWLSKRKVAYWGHGVNFQSKSPKALRERWKRLWVNSVDWWFSYTAATDRLLVQAGVPDPRITRLNNAVNTSALKRHYDSFSVEELRELRANLGIRDDDNVAIFCGSLYPEKKLNLLLAAADLLSARLQNFHLLILGGGPSAKYLEESAKTRPWIHLLGVRTGREKAGYLRLAKVMVNPGLLGLHILDSFSIGIPIVSTANALHSPEIAYIRNGENGVLVDDDVDTYADAVMRLLVDKDYYHDVSVAAVASGRLYSVENMADRFMDGIKKCLRGSAIAAQS